MDALLASYGDTSSDSDTAAQPYIPPASAILDPPSSTHITPKPTQRIRSFPHKKGNYALHVYIPITLSSPQREPIIPFLQKLHSSLPPDTLHAINLDVPLGIDLDAALKQEFHVSLGRTVPIRVHQIDSVVGMLRQRVREFRAFRIDFENWDVLVNDDGTRSFVCFEVVGKGLGEIVGMIKGVDEVYRFHNLPEFYENPRPHISVAWAFGDVSEGLRRVVVDEVNKGLMSCSVMFGGVVCKIGKKRYDICKIRD